ncbi:tetratricopeptide repeat protein [Trichloromonas sp.]|uniref:tetratricopeptide repeat protein n=1 Tax=Trichloromonas sp. TaxID=3069249 RepID=UPI002A46393B|nr:tetratricopeptide repeat protein [Trichloromonas sp.]
MKKETLFFIAVALIVGVLVGVLVSKGGHAPAPVQGGALAVPASNVQQNIQMIEKMVAADPGNRAAWVQLGHAYFDSRQAVKAVEAYNKALELDPNDPDVLTDQGVMFRDLGWFDRAEENFIKANELNPAHAQSLYNLGVVYRYDMNDANRAREVWTRYLQVNPSGPGSDNIRHELEFLGGASTLELPR